MRPKIKSVERASQRKIIHFNRKQREKFLQDIAKTGAMNRITIGSALYICTEFGYNTAKAEIGENVYQYASEVQDLLKELKTKNHRLKEMTRRILKLYSPKTEIKKAA